MNTVESIDDNHLYATGSQGVDDDTAWADFVIGILLCLSASFLTQSSNVLVKFAERANAKLVQNGEEKLSWYAWQNIMYFPLLIGGAILDVFAMGLLPQSLWAGLCCLDILIYTGISRFALNEHASVRVWIILCFIGAGVLLTSIGGPGPSHFEHSAVEQLLASAWYEHMLITPIIWASFGLAYYTCRARYAEILLKKGEQDHTQPDPTSAYNLTGIFCAAIATMHFQTAISLTVKSISPFHWGMSLTLISTIVLCALHFHCLWFMIQRLHAISAVPCYIIMTALSHAIYSRIIYDPKYQNLFWYILGIHIMLFSLVGFVVVSGMDARNKEKEETPEKI